MTKPANTPINTVSDLLVALGEMQKDTASVTIRIGGTADNRQVMHNCVTILEAPGAFFSRVVPRLTSPPQVTHGGVHITFPE